MSFRGKILAQSIVLTAPVFDGRTLNADGDQPCVLLHPVYHCPPQIEGERRPIRVSTRFDVDALIDVLLKPERPAIVYPPRGDSRCGPTGVPRRHPWSNFSDDLIDAIDSGEDFPDKRTELSAPPCIVGPDRPEIPFVPSDLRTTGPLEGVRFRRVDPLEGFAVTGVKRRLLAEYGGRKISEKAGDSWLARARNQQLKRLKLVCVKCGENLVERFGVGFVLCDVCEVEPHSAWDMKSVKEVKSNGEKNFEALAAFDFDYQYEERSMPLTLDEMCIKALVDAKKKAEKRTKKRLTKIEPQDVDLPLLDFELTLLLAVKYKGFTRPSSLNYVRAQRFAAQYAAVYLYQRSYAETAQLVPKTTAGSVRKLCTRARSDYEKALRKCKGVMPFEALVAERKGLLRSLYAPTLTTGHQCHSRTCCTA